tara:strand:- start:261 stop:755 length:495 start_codon:yes stop_codon:yes gene_type:complete
MGYFENIDIKDLNLKTDGETRYVNGGYTFIPWMESTDDNLYKGCLEDLLKLDWDGYELYLVGGLLQGWKTTDIDICITGTIGDDLIPLMEEAAKLGPFDLYYVKSLNEIKDNSSRIWEFAKHDCKAHEGAPRWHGQWKSDGLFWMCEKFDPKGREYTKEPLKLN